MAGIVGGSGVYRDANALVAMPFSLAVEHGGVPHWTPMGKFGRNANVGTATVPEDVWYGPAGAGGVYTGQPVAGVPEPVSIVSTDAADAVGGTGMRSVLLRGLLTEDDTEYTTEEVALNGITPVVSVNSWYRLNRAYGIEGGSSEANVGTITINKQTTTAIIFAVMAPEIAATQIAAYTVPAERELIINRLFIQMGRSTGAAGSANVHFQLRIFGTSIWRSIRIYTVTDSTDINLSTLSLTIPPKADVRVRVISVSDNSTIVTAEFAGELATL